MSRTFAHRPYHARLNDPAVCEPLHDHRTGPCDLLPLPDWAASVRADHGENLWRTHRCVWDLNWHRTPPLCGCRMCTGHVERVADRRRTRRQVRQQLAAGTYDTVTATS